jgi:hypothetical protein
MDFSGYEAVWLCMDYGNLNPDCFTSFAMTVSSRMKGAERCGVPRNDSQDNPMNSKPTPWKKVKLVTRNPYQRTAFRVVMMPREIIRHRTVSNYITQARDLVKTNPKAHTIQGEPVTLADLVEAEKVLQEEPHQARILEELIEHPTESLGLDHLKNLESELLESIQPRQGLAELPVQVDFLRLWLPELVEQILDEIGRPDPLFGGLELELRPPFGGE